MSQLTPEQEHWRDILLRELESQRERADAIARRMHLPVRGEDVSQEAAVRIMTFVQNGGVVRDADNPLALRVFILNCLNSAAVTILRRQQRTLPTVSLQDQQPAQTLHPPQRGSDADARRARELVELVRSLLSPDGLFALAVFLGEADKDAYAREHHISLRTAQRRFNCGVQELRRAFDRAQAERGPTSA